MHYLIESQNNSTRSHYHLYFIDEDAKLRNAK